MKEFNHLIFFVTLMFCNLFALERPSGGLRPNSYVPESMPYGPIINQPMDRTFDPCSEPAPTPCPPLNCPPCVNPCFIAGFFVASEVFNVPKVGSNFTITLVGTEEEDGITLGLYAITYNRPFCCPVSVVAFSSGISVSGDLEDCDSIIIDRPVEVRSSTRSNAVLRAPLGVFITFKAMPVT